MAAIVPKDGDVFDGETGTVLSGAKVLTGWVRDGADWKLTGQGHEAGPSHPATICRLEFPRCVYPHDLWVNGLLQSHVPSREALRPGAWFFDYVNDTIFIRDNPIGAVIETSVTSSAFSGPAVHVRIRGVVVERYANVAQTGAIDASKGRHWTIERSEIRFNHGIGLRIGDGSSVTHAYVHDNYQLGIGGSGDDVVIADSEIAANNRQFNDYWEGGGTKFVFTTNLVVRRNFVHHNQGPGLWTDINNVAALYEANRVEDNVQAGLKHEISYSAVIRWNVIRRNGSIKPYPYWVEGACIVISNSSDVEVYENICEDNWQGIVAVHVDRGRGNLGLWELRNLRVHHNVVTTINALPGQGRSGVAAQALSPVFDQMGNRFEANTYHTPSCAGGYFVWQDNDRSWVQWRSFDQDITGECY
jgi:hypothetical protein